MKSGDSRLWKYTLKIRKILGLQKRQEIILREKIKFNRTQEFFYPPPLADYK